MDGRFRSWCFTINNFNNDDLENVKRAIENAKMGIAEIEHQDVGTPHIQGYIYYNSVKSFNQVKEELGQRAHIERAKGSPKQNKEYCSKEGTVFVEKNMAKVSNPGFLEMYEDMQNMTPEQFSEKYPQFWVMHREKVMQVMIDNAMRHVMEYNGELKDKNVWLFGKPGLGKSRWAASQGTYEEIFKKNFNKWWDGYKLLSTKIVIIEDYPCEPIGNTLVQHLKIWGDRYPFEGECKGSHMLIEPRRFILIVTSNYPISRCFQNEEDINAIKRRFDEIEIHNGDMYNQNIIKMDREKIGIN